MIFLYTSGDFSTKITASEKYSAFYYKKKTEKITIRALWLRVSTHVPSKENFDEMSTAKSQRSYIFVKSNADKVNLKEKHNCIVLSSAEQVEDKPLYIHDTSKSGNILS